MTDRILGLLNGSGRAKWSGDDGLRLNRWSGSDRAEADRALDWLAANGKVRRVREGRTTWLELIT